MKVLRGRNVNTIWPMALELILREGDPRQSRNGPVLVHPEPVTTVYEKPTERVLMDPVRDANPIFHLHEALWMLAGQDDAKWLDQFVRGFSQRYGEGDGIMHGAYGRRWRDWFARSNSTSNGDSLLVNRDGDAADKIDQLDEAVRLLRTDPYDRQVVIQMWDPSSDLGVPGLRDRPCNQQVLLRADRVETSFYDERGMVHSTVQSETRLLDMTVTCRSNDVVFGCYGANVVHFSILQEYLAARIGVGVGRYTQVSNNWHLYSASTGLADPDSAARSAIVPYPGATPLVDHPESFDEEVRRYVEDPAWASRTYPRIRNRFLVNVALPLYEANVCRKLGHWDAAREAALRCHAPDWCYATTEWLARRAPKG